MINKTNLEKCKEVVKDYSECLSLTQKEAQNFIGKAFDGGEFTDFEYAREWYEERFIPNLIEIDKDDYTSMCTSALLTTMKTTATDFGSSRQRDLGQIWADQTRGYLGEMGVKKFIEKNWNIECKLKHELGNLEDFLASDIYKVKKDSDSSFRLPNKTIGIKTTKLNGMWLDIGGDQFFHNDFHVLPKVSLGRDHLFGFMKTLSVFKEKILPEGIRVGSLTKQTAESIFYELPNHGNCFVYISGFADSSEDFVNLPYKGKMGNIHFTIDEWKGSFRKSDLEEIKTKESMSNNGKVQFKNIQELTGDKRYLFNTGSLYFDKNDWSEKIIQTL